MIGRVSEPISWVSCFICYSWLRKKNEETLSTSNAVNELSALLWCYSIHGIMVYVTWLVNVRGVIEQLVELVALSAALCIEEGNKN